LKKIALLFILQVLFLWVINNDLFAWEGDFSFGAQETYLSPQIHLGDGSFNQGATAVARSILSVENILNRFGFEEQEFLKNDEVKQVLHNLEYVARDIYGKIFDQDNQLSKDEHEVLLKYFWEKFGFLGKINMPESLIDKLINHRNEFGAETMSKLAIGQIYSEIKKINSIAKLSGRERRVLRRISNQRDPNISNRSMDRIESLWPEGSADLKFQITYRMFNEEINILYPGCGYKAKALRELSDRNLGYDQIKFIGLDWDLYVDDQDEENNISLIEGDAVKLPLGSESIDIIFETGLMEYLGEDEIAAAVKERMRVLKPGGKIILLFYHLSLNISQEIKSVLADSFKKDSYNITFVSSRKEIFIDKYNSSPKRTSLKIRVETPNTVEQAI